jgi:predicted acetyltransferase
MMELYLYDFSEFDDSDLDEHGYFGYGDLDYFWFEPTHAAFLVTVDDKLAGFVLVDNEVVVDGYDRSICEFFIMRKYRRKGVGSIVARDVFGRFSAKWEVRVVEKNTPAQAFWRGVIAEYTQATSKSSNSTTTIGTARSFTLIIEFCPELGGFRRAQVCSRVPGE